MAIETWQERVDHDLYGNGRPGLIEEIRDYLAQNAGKRNLVERAVLIMGGLSTFILLIQGGAAVIKAIAK